MVPIEGSRSIEIAASAGRLWAMVADVSQMGSWSPLTTAARWIAPATGPAVGARFTGTNRLPVVRRWTSTATVTAAEPGVVFAFVVGADPERPNSRWEYRFDAVGSRTRVTESWQMIREPSIVLLYYQLVGQRQRLAAGVEDTLARLRAAAESS